MLSLDAKARGGRYRVSRAGPANSETAKLRTEFLGSLGRLSAFETASLSLWTCRSDLQLRAHADDLARDYFHLWQVLARRGHEASETEPAADRLDHFATQLGRLEGLADALVIAGRDVRLFPLPHIAWLPVTASP